MATSILPKIVIEGFTSNEPFVKFTQKYEWTTTNPCLAVVGGYTDLNGLLINGNENGTENVDTIVSRVSSNISFGIKGDNANFIFKKDNTELLKIANNGNVGIGTTNLDRYKLNINGDINSIKIYKNNTDIDNIYLAISNNFWLKNNNNNIYTNSFPSIINVGMGTSAPIANLHIYGLTSKTNVDYSNDGTIIISRFNDKTDNNNLLNFKLGYIDNNFTFGNYTIDDNLHTWNKQFSINSSAPDNSLVINASGNIGIGTTANSLYKLNINGTLNATSISGIGSSITNIDYKNITIDAPDLKNLNNWRFNDSLGIKYIYSDNIISIGSSTIPQSGVTYKLNVTGDLNVISDIFVNGTNLTNLYLSQTTASSLYVKKTDADEKYYYLVKDVNDNINKIYFQDSYKTKTLVLGLDSTNIATTINNNILVAHGKIQAEKFSGDGTDIYNISFTNINNVPNFITSTQISSDYYNRAYMDSTYRNTISNVSYSIAPTITQFNTLYDSVTKIYDNAITIQLLDALADKFTSNIIAVYHCNLRKLPYSYNVDGFDNILGNKYFGFGIIHEEGTRINVNGLIKTDRLISSGPISENGNTLSNIYISSNVFNSIAPFYDTIVDRKIAMYEYENIYPPQNTVFNINNNTTITNSPYGNGLYKVDSSIKIKIPNSPYFSIFNSNNNAIIFSINDDYEKINNNFIFDSNIPNDKICTKNISLGNNINIFGHWIQLYYSNMFIASKIFITVKTNLYNAPKTIYVVATKDATVLPQEVNVDSYKWEILINNYTITAENYIINLSDDFYTVIIPMPSNTTSYYYYRIIITEIFSPESSSANTNILKINQIGFYGYEKKKEWRNSGANIYSYSNISIKTIDDNSPYALNVNGMIYSSNNIYTASNIGIGTTNPIGNLHIGSITNSNDGTLIIAKHNGTIGRILKMGYDSAFNFTIGDYGSSGSLNWKPQFYINSNAPSNSLIINIDGNIGIGTTIHTDNYNNTYKLSINGATNIKGSLNQQEGNLNKFSGDIYASNNVSIISNLNAWKVYASNIRTTDYINSYGIISSYSNIGIGTSTSLLGSLHIQTIPNNISIWNISSNLNIGDKLRTLIGSNSTYGFYNNYNYNNATDFSKNYLSWNTANTDVFNITNSGNIGIGITNPSGILQVDNGNKFFISSTNDDNAIIGLNTNDTINTKIHLIGTNKSINYYASNHIYYNFEKNEKMRIDNNGNIGIGTTILTDTSGNIYKLSINGSIYSSNKIDVLNSISIGSIIDNSDGNLNIYRKNASYANIFKFGYESLTQNFIMGNIVSSDWKKQIIINSTAPSNSFYINPNGNIGINNLNPLGTLHIGSNSDVIANTGSIVISQKHAATGVNRNFKIGYNDSYDFVFGDFGNNSTQVWNSQFYINSNAPANSLMINSLGNIGIGTINIDNTKKLIVNGNTNIIGNTNINGSLIQSGVSTNNLFAGNVGITTTTNNNDYNFYVNGTANISTGLTTSNISNTGYLIQKNIVKIGETVSLNANNDYRFYVNASTCIEAATDIKGVLKHSGGQFISDATTTLINSNVRINGLVSLNSNINIIGNANISNGIYTSNIKNIGYLIQNGMIKIGPSVDINANNNYNFYVNTSTCIEAATDIKGIFKHSGGEFISDATTTLINSNIRINGLFNLNSNLGINITSNIFSNVLQVEDGGKLRISNNRTDYTCIGTSNIDNSTNTRILINGSTKTGNPGNIEYYSTSTGKHIFYSSGGSTELMKLDYDGPITMNKELYVSGSIKENNNYLSDIYVKLDQLSNLSVANFNLNKKYGYISSTSSISPITINGTNYYKFDIDLSSLKVITLPSSTVKYRNFNIKCYMNNGIFEMNGNILPSILQYDIYMSNGQIATDGIDTSTYPNNGPNTTIHIYATGTPENFKLSNLLPCHITLLRTTNFNYLSIISKISNLSVSYIIEDYLG